MKQFLLLTFAFLSLASCSPNLVPFSQKMVDNYNWSEEELKRVQFYLSDDIVLYRRVTGGSTQIENGTIKIKDGKKIEEISFKKGTPGVLIFSPKEERLAVAFEDSDDKYLMFGPNPKIGNRYALLAKEWQQSIGKVSYAGEEFNITKNSGFSGLMVDIDKLTTVQKKSKIVKGREL